MCGPGSKHNLLRISGIDELRHGFSSFFIRVCSLYRYTVNRPVKVSG